MHVSLKPFHKTGVFLSSDIARIVCDVVKWDSESCWDAPFTNNNNNKQFLNKTNVFFIEMYII